MVTHPVGSVPGDGVPGTRNVQRRSRLRIGLVGMATALATLTAAGAADALLTQTWISGEGDDANPCTITALCKTIPGAFSKTEAGGEIRALDPAGFGQVTVTKAMTIDLSFVRGGVLYSSGAGVQVNAGASDTVIIRGIDFVGTTGALTGVRIIQAGSVVIEDCTFTGTATTAISIEPTAANTTVTINGVDIRNNLGTGIAIVPAAGRTAKVAIRNTVITGTQTAVQAGAGATAWLQGTKIFGNALGLNAAGGGVINLFADSQVFGNTVAGEPTSLLGMAPGVPGATGPAGATGPTGAQSRDATAAILLRATLLRATRGRRVRADYVSTVSGPGVVTIRKGTRTLTSVPVRILSGAHAVQWNGRVGRRTPAAGVYSMTVQVTGPGGTVARHRTPLVIE